MKSLPSEGLRCADTRVPGAGTPCTYCKRTMLAWTETHPTRDHVVPASRGGRETVLCCYQCNQIKGDAMPAEWDIFMRANPSWWLTGRRFTVSPPKRWFGVCPVMLACSTALFHERYKHRGIFRGPVSG